MLQVTSDLYCVMICCVIIFLKPVLDSVVCVDNCKLFHKAGIAWYGVRAENCVLASVYGRLLYWRVILSCCEWLTMGKKISKDDGNLFARRSCTCSAVTTLYMSWNFKFLSPAGAVGPGTGDIATPPVRLSVVRPSVTFSFRTVTQKRIAVFSRNFAGTCTK